MIVVNADCSRRVIAVPREARVWPWRSINNERKDGMLEKSKRPRISVWMFAQKQGRLPWHSFVQESSHKVDGRVSNSNRKTKVSSLMYNEE